MASEVSIIVRARDMATRVLRNIGAETQKLSKGLGFGGLAGGLARGGAAFGLGYAAIRSIRAAVDSFKEMAEYARSTGDYTLISAQSIRNAESLSRMFQDIRDNAAITAGRVMGWFGGSGEGQTTWRDEAARVAERDKRIAAARAGIDAVDSQSRMDVDKLAELRRLESVAVSALAKANPNDWAEVAELELQVIKAAAEINREIAVREKASAEASEKATALARAKAEEAAEDEKKQKQRAFSEAISRASAGIQGEGMALFAGGRSRRISASQSAAMGERIRTMTGDDPMKAQRETAFTLQQIYRLLGGGNSGR